jgi:hypothetical protein
MSNIARSTIYIYSQDCQIYFRRTSLEGGVGVASQVSWVAVRWQAAGASMGGGAARGRTHYPIWLCMHPGCVFQDAVEHPMGVKSCPWEYFWEPLSHLHVIFDLFSRDWAQSPETGLETGTTSWTMGARSPSCVSVSDPRGPFLAPFGHLGVYCMAFGLPFFTCWDFFGVVEVCKNNRFRWFKRR